MTFSADHKDAANVILVDAMGKPVEGVSVFDTQTERALVFIRATEGYVVDSDKKTVSVNVTIKGAKLVWKQTGEPYVESK